MSISEEIGRLGELHQRGVLSDDEFATAKARVLDEAARAPTGAPTPAGLAAVNQLRRSVADRWLGGVCGGLAGATGLATWVWRLAFTLLAVCGGAGALMYVLLWIFVPISPVPLGGGPGRLNRAS